MFEISTFRDRFLRVWMRSRCWRIGYLHCLAISQITLSADHSQRSRSQRRSLSAQSISAQITLSAVDLSADHSQRRSLSAQSISAQITLSSVDLSAVDLCLLLSEVDCFRVVWNEARLQSLMSPWFVLPEALLILKYVCALTAL
jgi:hypothetical protein